MRAVLIAALAIAVVTDVKWHKVFNWLTWPAIGVGLVLGALGGGGSMLTCIEGLLSGVIAGLVFMVFFRSGAGDAKLLMVVGTFAGPWFLLGSALYGAIAAFPMALVLMWRRGAFAYTLHNFAANAAQRAVGNREVEMSANSKAGKMPYALAIAAGAAITYLIHGWAGLKVG